MKNKRTVVLGIVGILLIVCFGGIYLKLSSRGKISVKVTNQSGEEISVWLESKEQDKIKLAAKETKKMEVQVVSEPTSFVFCYYDLDDTKKSIVIAEYLGAYNYGSVKIQLTPNKELGILEVQVEDKIKM